MNRHPPHDQPFRPGGRRRSTPATEAGGRQRSTPATEAGEGGPPLGADTHRGARQRAMRTVGAAVSTLRDRSSRPRRLLRHRLTRTVVSFFLLLGMGFWYLWTYQNGPALAKRLARNFNRKARGRMTIGSVRWTPRAAFDILLGRDHKVVVRDLKLYDTKGRLVAHFPRIEAWGKLWPLIWRGNFEVSRARCTGARFRIDYYRRPDGPNPVTGTEYEVGLISLFEPRRPRTVLPAEASHYLFSGLSLKRASIELHHESFDVAFRDVDATGALLVTTASRTSPGVVHFTARPKGGTGTLRLGGKTLVLRDVVAPVLHTDPTEPTTLRFAVGGVAEGARFRVAADIHHLIGRPDPTIALTGLVTEFAPPLARLLHLPLDGNAETLAIQMSGPLKAPTIQLTASGLSARPQIHGHPIPVEDIQAEGRLAGGYLRLDRVTAQTLQGALSFRGQVNLRQLTARGTFSLRHLRTGPLLSAPSLYPMLDGWVSGTFTLSGPLRTLSPVPRSGAAAHMPRAAGVAGRRPRDRSRGGTQPRQHHEPLARRPPAHAEGLGIDSLDLTLARRGAVGLLPRRVRLRASGRYAAATLEVTRARVTGHGIRAAAHGQIHLASRQLRLTVQAQLHRLRAALRQLGLPPVARALSVQARLRGPWRRPQANGKATVHRLRVGAIASPKIAARFSFSRGELLLARIRAPLAGGAVRGKAHLWLQDPRTGRLCHAPRFRTRLTLTHLSLQRLLPGLPFTGRASARVGLRGRVGALHGRASLTVHRPSVLGLRLRTARARVALTPASLRLRRLEVLGYHGERLAVQGQVGLRSGALDLRGDMADLPMALLARAAASRGLRGRASGSFHLSGRAAAPVLQAAITLARVRLQQVVLGRGTVRISPAGNTNQSRITGRLFDRFALAGTLSLHPEPRVRLRVTFRDLPVHDLLPWRLPLPGRFEARISGSVTLTVHLRRGLEQAEAMLSRVQLSLEQPPSLVAVGPPGKILLENDGPVHLRYDGSRLRVVRARLVGSGSHLRLSGTLTPRDVALAVAGRVSLRPAAWLAARWLDALQGRLWIRGRLAGPWHHLRWASDLELAGVVAQPVDRPLPVRIASARVHLSDRELHIASSRIAIDTEEFSLRGRVALKGFHPDRLDLDVRGKLSAQVLRLLWPHSFYHVSGRARAAVRLAGTLQTPQVEGRVTLEPVTFTLRGSGREFSVQGGQVNLARRHITLREIRGSVDDGAYVVDGTVWLRPSWPWDMDLTVRGQAIPVKKPRSYELELNALLHYRLHRGRASLTGTVDVADGRFTETFDVVSSAFLRRRTFEVEPAIWETSPLLRDARLNLSIATRGPLLIKNNLADIRLEGNISLSGTPRKPKIGGRIQAESGTFRIPFLRGEYTVRSGEVDFDSPFGFGETYVRIVGETTYTDRTETDHDITLTLEGPLSRIAIKLASNTGLNQSQILMLLASGRTVDQLRQQIHGGDRGPGSSARSSNPLEAYDSSLKQVTGDFLSQLVAKPLQAWTRLDLVRLEMGTESFQVRVNKNLGRNIRLTGEAEFGLLGRQRQEGRVEVRILDQLDVRARARHLIPGEDTVIDEDRYQGRLEMRYRIRLQGSLRRALGF